MEVSRERNKFVVSIENLLFMASIPILTIFLIFANKFIFFIYLGWTKFHNDLKFFKIDIFK